MTTESEGVLVDIVGIKAHNRGRSCEEHTCCGSILELDTVVRFRSVQIVNDDGKEETALAVYWVTDAIDRCRVGFLPRHLIKHKDAYDGRTAQIVEFLAVSDSPSDKAKSSRNAGVCRAVMLELGKKPESKKKKKRPSECGNSPELTKKATNIQTEDSLNS
jgi:hypothetical protein